MAQTKLQQQIEASAKRIQDEQRRLKTLERQQAERDRKDRNHRLCKRHGFIESLLPDIINLTDEQFQSFVKNHIANKHGISAIADFTAKNATSSTAYTTGQSAQSNAATSDTTAKQSAQTDTQSPTSTTDAKPQNGGTSAPNDTGQSPQSKTTAPTGTKPQSNATPAPNGTGQNNSNQQPKNTTQNTTNPANKQGETA